MSHMQFCRAQLRAVKIKPTAKSIHTSRLIGTNPVDFLEARSWTAFGLPGQLTTGALPIARDAPRMTPPDRSIRTRAIGKFALGSDT